MKRILAISEKEAKGIIHKEIATKLRQSYFYDLASSLSNDRCRLPQRGQRILDFDYQLMNVLYEFEIGESEIIPLANVLVSIPCKVLDYRRSFDDPYIRPGGSQVAYPTCAIECCIPGEHNLVLDQDKQGSWIGYIDWGTTIIQSSMIKIVR